MIKILHESWNQNLLGFKSISGLVEKIKIEKPNLLFYYFTTPGITAAISLITLDAL